MKHLIKNKISPSELNRAFTFNSLLVQQKLELASQVALISMLAALRVLRGKTIISAQTVGLLMAGLTLPLIAQTENTTITTTTTGPAVVPVSPPVVVTQSVTTTSTTMKARTLYLRNGVHGMLKNGTQVYVRPNGRIYNDESEYIGHLTNLDGDDIISIPEDRRYKIRNLSGAVVASTKLSSSFDEDRTVSLAREDSEGHLIVETTISTTPAVIATPVTVQSSTTTTTQTVPARQTGP